MLYAISCTSMLVVAAAGLLSTFGVLVSANFLGPLAEPVVVLPGLGVSLALTIFGMLRTRLLQIVLATAGGALTYAGMSNMFATQAMSGMPSEAFYISWTGILLVASSFLISRLRSSSQFAGVRIETIDKSPSIASEDKPVAPFVLSLVAGLFLILGSLAMNAFGMLGGFMTMFHMMGMPGMSAMPSMIDQMTQTMHMPIAFHTLFFSLGLVSGSLVFVGALMLYLRPEEHVSWGAVILAFSIVGIVAAMGGFLVGLILGILGGTLAISWRPVRGA